MAQFLYCFAESRSNECRSVDCHSAKCRGAIRKFEYFNKEKCWIGITFDFKLSDFFLHCSGNCNFYIKEA
jgi:hypothetical protein